MYRLTGIALIVGLLLCSCSESTEDTTTNSVTFRGRVIDLKPYVEGFPYSSFSPFYSAGKLYYNHRDKTTMLKEVDLDGTADLTAGKLISDIDFATRNVWGLRYREADGHIYWSGDEVNDEVINLYRLHPSDRSVAKLTDVPYIFGWQWQETGDQVAYVARLGDKEARLGELRILDLTSGAEQVILQDSPEFRFTWGAPSWQPGGEGVVVSLVKNADRTFGNLGYVNFATNELQVITDPGRPRAFPQAYDKWLNNNEFIYLSNEDGYQNLYSYDVRRMSGRQVTDFERDVSDMALLTVDGRKFALMVISHPVENELLLVDPASGKIVHRQNIGVNISISDVKDNRAYVEASSASSKFRIDELVVTKEKFDFTTRVGLPPGLEQQIVHAQVERIEYPTFDIDPATGRQRMLHAYLYHPENPLPNEQQTVMIQSFYGGANQFSERTQILAEAGIYVLSPSPRGSRGFGRDFSALNDKDLGGNEIVDIVYAGKYISEKLDIPPARIGVYGGSHGGYATMRLLTFPGEINGVRAQFDWGFGISHAGFSDIIHFYKNCNIPDWVTLEAGDPATEAAKLRDRSPLYHSDKMSGKLLLTHGTNDSRVPIEGSRQMADSLRYYGKDVTLVEFKGQGHGIKGLDNQIRVYKIWFEFLESLKEG